MSIAEATAQQAADIRGVIPIVVTPFDADGGIDEAGLESEIAFLLERGIRWVGIGYGSEVPRLTQRERNRVVAVIRSAGGSALGVVGNAEVTGLHAGIEALAAAAAAAPDAVMVRPAHVQGVPAAALVDTLARVFDDVGVPIVLQDAPQHTGVVLDAPTLADLVRDVESVVAVKIEPHGGVVPKMAAVRAALRGAPGRIIGGNGGREYIQELGAGADGTMPGPAYVELYQAIEAFVASGRSAEAWKLLGSLTPVMGLGAVASNMDGFLHAQKHLLARRGVALTTALRAPANDIGPEVGALIDAVWDGIGADAILAEAARIAAEVSA